MKNLGITDLVKSYSIRIDKIHELTHVLNLFETLCRYHRDLYNNYEYIVHVHENEIYVSFSKTTGRGIAFSAKKPRKYVCEYIDFINNKDVMVHLFDRSQQSYLLCRNDAMQYSIGLEELCLYLLTSIKSKMYPNPNGIFNNIGIYGALRDLFCIYNPTVNITPLNSIGGTTIEVIDAIIEGLAYVFDNTSYVHVENIYMVHNEQWVKKFLEWLLENYTDDTMLRLNPINIMEQINNLEPDNIIKIAYSYIRDINDDQVSLLSNHDYNVDDVSKSLEGITPINIKKLCIEENGNTDDILTIQNMENDKVKIDIGVAEESKKDDLKELPNDNGTTYDYVAEKHFPHGNFTITADEFAKVHKLINEENTHDFTLGIDLINYGHRAQMVDKHMINEYLISVTANGVSYGGNSFPLKDLDKLKLPYFIKLKFTPGPAHNAITVSVGDMSIGFIKTNDSYIPNKISFEQLNSFSKMFNDIKKMVTDYLIKEQISKPIIHSF